MAKPSIKPRWADVVSGDPTKVLAPPGVKQDVGFATAERPPAQFLNWLLWVIYLWINYVDGITSEALTWAAAHTFQALVTFQVTPTAPDYKYTNSLTRMIPGTEGVPQNTASTIWRTGSAGELFTNATSSTPDGVTIPIVVTSGERITLSVNLAVNAGSMAGTGAIQLYRWDGTGSATLITTATIGVTGVQTITVITNHDVVSGFAYAAFVSFSSGTGLNFVIRNVKLVVSRP